jgi:hypothetical protein
MTMNYRLRRRVNASQAGLRSIHLSPARHFIAGDHQTVFTRRQAAPGKSP